jgi:LacI family transcriptional regulator
MNVRVTIADVAKAAAVSTMTVSRVLNGVPGAGAETRERVLRAVQDLGYRPNALAKGLKERASRTVALLVPDITNPFFPEIIRGAEDHARAEGYALLLCNVAEDVEREADLLAMLESKRVDGVIVCSARLPDDALAVALARHEATVLVNRRLDSAIAGTIAIDYEGGAREAVRHLVVDRGCRAIGLLAGPRNSRGGAQRLAGAREALARHGLEPIAIASCTPDIAGGTTALSTGVFARADGLVCYNDLVAVGASRALAASGAERPAIVGFDDIPLAELVTPSLTSLRVDKYEIGRAAMRMLLDRRAGVGLTSAIVIQPTLVVRDSSTPSSGGWNGRPSGEVAGASG